MKKLINDPGAVVPELLEGLELIHPGLARLPGAAVIVRADIGSSRGEQVGVISGGGSGHEPAHAGYVGAGMLSAAVAGDVFTSPSPAAVSAALRAVTGPRGALMIVKNYTGDRLNFGLAAEMARLQGADVEMVIVADDVALSRDGDHAGRRGLAGTVLIHKIAGAAAAEGLGLAEVAAEARAAAKELWTMGVALSPCTVPAAGVPGFELGPDEIEMGLGIHGEAGVGRSALEPAEMVVNRLLANLLVDGHLESGSRVVLMVNNLGATPPMELAIVARSAIRGLESQGIEVERAYVGTFLSALEMAGVSLTLLRVDDQRLRRLDAPTGAPAWPNAADRPRRIEKPLPDFGRAEGDAPVVGGRSAVTPLDHAISRAVVAAAEAIIADEHELNERDRVTGDGDIGTSLGRGARAVIEGLPGLPLDDPARALHEVGLILQGAMGGTSGPLYAVFLLRAAARLRRGPIEDRATWAEAFRDGCAGISELGGAEAGDRTMLDALLPARDALGSALDSGAPAAEALKLAADAAQLGANETALLKPRRGRSSYLGDRVLGSPDPGAEAVAAWLRAIAASAAAGGEHAADRDPHGEGFRRR